MPKRQLAPRCCSCRDPDCSTCFPGPPSATFGKCKLVIGIAEVNAPAVPGPWTSHWGRASIVQRKVSLLDLSVFCHRTCFTLKPDPSVAARGPSGSFDMLEESALVGCIGVISMPLESPLKEVRQALERKFKKELPLEFRFLHPRHGALDTGAEVGQLSFRYKDLVWEEAQGPAHLSLMLPGYIEGEQLPEPESRTREYKSLASAVWNRPCCMKKLASNEKPARCAHPECLAKNALTALSDFLRKGYIGSFLNSGGGVLMLGIEDADRRVRLKIDDATGYVGLTDKDLDDLVRVVDSSVGNLDPAVDDDLVRVRFVQVFPSLAESCCCSAALPEEAAAAATRETRKAYVIEVHVAPGRRHVYFESRNSMLAFVRKEGSKHQLDPASALSRLREDARQNPLSVQEGWRSVYVEPDIFGDLVRNVRKAWRLHKDQQSDHFVGRAAIFKRISEALEGHHGVVLMGGDGTGKTAILQQLVCGTPVATKNINPSPYALGYNFASSDREHSMKPPFVLQNLLGFILSDRLTHDLDVIGSEVKDILNADRTLLKQLSSGAIRENWEAVLSGAFATALNRAKPPDSKKSRLLLCFDGLSVSSHRQGSEAGSLERFVARAAQLLPEWLGFVVSVPGPFLPKSFDRGMWQVIHLDGQGEEAQDLVQDMQSFAALQLSSSSTKMAVPAENGKGKVSPEEVLDETAMEELCRRANGSYVWLKTALDCLRQGALSLRQLLEMPSGLSEEFFQKLFSSRFKQGSSIWQDLQPLLALFCAGGELTLQQLAQIRWSLLPDVPPPEPLCQHLEHILRAAGGILHFEPAASSEVAEQVERSNSSYCTLPLEAESSMAPSAESVPHCRLVDSVARWLMQGLTDQDFALNMEVAHSQLAAYMLRKATLAPQNLRIESSLKLSNSEPPSQKSLRALARAKSEGPTTAAASASAAPPDTPAASSNDLAAQHGGRVDIHPGTMLLCAEDTYRLATHLSSSGLPLEKSALLWQDTLLTTTGFVPVDAALRLAARRGKEGAAALLLAVGAQPCAGSGSMDSSSSSRSPEEATPVATCATLPSFAERPTVASQERYAATALGMAARKGQGAVLQALLQHISARDLGCLDAALVLAKQHKHELCCEMLQSAIVRLSRRERNDTSVS